MEKFGDFSKFRLGSGFLVNVMIEQNTYVSLLHCCPRHNMASFLPWTLLDPFWIKQSIRVPRMAFQRWSEGDLAEIRSRSALSEWWRFMVLCDHSFGKIDVCISLYFFGLLRLQSLTSEANVLSTLVRNPESCIKGSSNRCRYSTQCPCYIASSLLEYQFPASVHYKEDNLFRRKHNRITIHLIKLKLPK